MSFGLILRLPACQTLAYTVIDAADSSLNKTSVLVTGETEALVVDAAFTRADGHRIVAEVLDSGKRLTTVVVSAGDPDFYFGAEVIADAFPEAVFLAPADVIEHIEHSYEGKLQAWAHLGPNLPTRLVDLTPLTATSLAVDGTTIEVRRGSDLLGDRSWYLFEPASRSLFGGVLLFEGLHVWTADSATPELQGRVDPRAGRAGGARPGVRRRGPPDRRCPDGPHRHHPHPRLPRALREDRRLIRRTQPRPRHRSWRPTRTPA